MCSCSVVCNLSSHMNPRIVISVNFLIIYFGNLFIKNCLGVKDNFLRGEGYFSPQVEYLKNVLTNIIIPQNYSIIHYNGF